MKRIYVTGGNGFLGKAVVRALASHAEQLDKALGALPPLGLARPASLCPACGHQIRWYENIPVLSWLVLRGRCSACQTSISIRYPLVEVGTALLFAALAWRTGPQPSALLWCGAGAVLLATATAMPGANAPPYCGSALLTLWAMTPELPFASALTTRPVTSEPK